MELSLDSFKTLIEKGLLFRVKQKVDLFLCAFHLRQHFGVHPRAKSLQLLPILFEKVQHGLCLFIVETEFVAKILCYVLGSMLRNAVYFHWLRPHNAKRDGHADDDPARENHARQQEYLCPSSAQMGEAYAWVVPGCRHGTFLYRFRDAILKKTRIGSGVALPL